jgi:hypothetical protein
VHQAPLAEVLNALSSEYGLQFVSPSTLTQTVTLSFDGPLCDGVGLLADAAQVPFALRGNVVVLGQLRDWDRVLLVLPSISLEPGLLELLTNGSLKRVDGRGYWLGEWRQADAVLRYLEQCLAPQEQWLVEFKFLRKSESKLWGIADGVVTSDIAVSATLGDGLALEKVALAWRHQNKGSWGVSRSWSDVSPWFLALDGLAVDLDVGEKIPVPITQISGQLGTVTTQSYQYVSVGTRIECTVVGRGDVARVKVQLKADELVDPVGPRTNGTNWTFSDDLVPGQIYAVGCFPSRRHTHRWGLGLGRSDQVDELLVCLRVRPVRSPPCTCERLPTVK